MIKAVLDCDPGLDDAFAIMLAVRHLDLLGITTVAGNVEVEKTTANALRILDVLGRADIPVHSGCPAPLACPLTTAAHIHGPSGLGGAERLPPPSRPASPGHAADFIIESARANPGLALAAVGPLTNVALALRREPRLAADLSCISLMGGSTTCGNTTVSGEFNILVDPEAAHIVFTSGVPIKMSGLNLTRQACVRPDALARIAAVGTRSAALAADLLRHFMESTLKAAGIEGADLHDALAVAWLVRPDFFVSQPLHVAVELRGEHTRGMTVCDYRHLRGMEAGVDIARLPTRSPRGAAPNAEVGLDLDAPAFFDFLLETLKSLP